MDLQVVGRHALLFDDDATAAFVNSKEALVEWNSLSIDRYDVRHLLSDPPSSFRKHRHQQSAAPSPPPPDAALESDLDLDRYADLPSSSSVDEPPDAEAREDASQYSAVPFSYETGADSSYQTNAEVDFQNTGFCPPFSVPESLLQNLPPTEKVHQIIARTAMFVSEHGGQSEIVLRVKQGDNPTFGFLMPHHHLHPYFRYLVDHRELLRIGIDGNSHRDNANNLQKASSGAGEALSLLGSVYGSVEDEDGVAGGAEEINRKDSFEISAAGVNNSQSGRPNSGSKASQKDETVSEGSQLPQEKALPLSATRIGTAIKTGSVGGKKKEGAALISSNLSVDKSKASPISKVDMPVIEPPSDLRRLVDRIVEIILKNGKEFETVLVDQDKAHGRFEFLLPSSQFHPYYLKVLRMAQESKKIHKGVNSDKDGASWLVIGKKTLAKDRDSVSPESAVQDLPLEYDRKEKFKMVIGKSKKDVLDQPPKGAEEQHAVSVDVTAAAAILQAATRGIKNPILDIFSKTPINGSNNLVGDETGQAVSFGGPQSAHTHKKGETVTTGKVLASGSESNSSIAGMTEEQKKAERLKRARMFAAMIKSGAAPLGKEPLHGLSVEQLGLGIAMSGKDLTTRDANKSEGCLFAVGGNSEKSDKSEGKVSGGERQSRKKRHYRSRRHDDEEEEDEKEEDDDKERRHSQKKHKSHRSSHQKRDRSKDWHKHRKRHSSSKSKESRHHRHDIPSDDDDERRHRYKHDDLSEDEEKEHRHQKNKSLKDEKGHRKRSSKHEDDDDSHRHHKRGISSEDKSTYPKHKLECSPKDENRHERRLDKRLRISHSEDGDLEEGEISRKSVDGSLAGATDRAGGKASLVVSNVNKDKMAPSLPPETTVVSDELRAKIRAMLLATM